LLKFNSLFITITLLLFFLPSILSECADCPADTPVKWTSVQTCGCDFRGPQGPVGTKGPTGVTGPRGPFGPSAANPLTPGTAALNVDVPHNDIFSVIPGNPSTIKNSLPLSLTFINVYTDSVVRIIVTANIVDRCPQNGPGGSSLTGQCTVAEGPNDLTFVYQLYSANGALENGSLVGATLLDEQTVEFQQFNPDYRNIVLFGVVDVGSLEDSTNRQLYFNVEYLNPVDISNNFLLRKMALDVDVSFLGFPLSLGSRKKKDLDEAYRNYFLEEVMSPMDMDIPLL